ncbi:MAG: histone deacetylase [Planctomycetota bacterium]|nr:histone deacetylase [Planctomycetota bacterium]
MTALVYDDVYLEHDTGPHPENAERLRATCAHLKKTGMWDKLAHVPARKATDEELGYVHTKQHIESIKRVAQCGGGYLDMDTVMSKGSLNAALSAAGGIMAAIDAVVAGPESDAFCMVRPPGHHATPTHAMGFCLFNNIAIGARHAQRKHGIERIFIVDWDVHHGNGTQDTFYTDPSVLLFSTHRYPFYPGTGHDTETGEGAGKGFTVNRPMSYDVTREEFIAAFESVLTGPAANFNPGLVLVSAGFDAYIHDPIGGLSLEVEDFEKLTRLVKNYARKHCRGKVVSTLEGGYNTRDLPRCIEAHLRGFAE